MYVHFTEYQYTLYTHTAHTAHTAPLHHCTTAHTAHTYIINGTHGTHTKSYKESIREKQKQKRILPLDYIHVISLIYTNILYIIIIYAYMYPHHTLLCYFTLCVIVPEWGTNPILRSCNVLHVLKYANF